MRKNNTIIKVSSALLILVIAGILGSDVCAKEELVKVEIVDQWEAESSDGKIENYNVSVAPPERDDLIAYGITAPNTYVDLNDGPLEFDGEAEDWDLYTENGFKGKERVLVVVTNYRDEPLTVKLKMIGGITVKTLTVPANAGQATSVTGLNSILGYYLMFRAPCRMVGRVS